MRKTPTPNRELGQYDPLADTLLQAAEDIAAKLRQSQDVDEIVRLARTHVRLGRVLRHTLKRSAAL